MSYIVLQKRYKLRKITVGNKSGDSYGITIPKQVAQFFQDVLLTIYMSGNSIILESGANVIKKEIKNEQH